MGGLNRKNVAASPNYEAIDGSLERYDPVEAIGAIIQCLLEGIITDARWPNTRKSAYQRPKVKIRDSTTVFLLGA